MHTHTRAHALTHKRTHMRTHILYIYNHFTVLQFFLLSEFHSFSLNSLHLISFHPSLPLTLSLSLYYSFSLSLSPIAFLSHRFLSHIKSLTFYFSYSQPLFLHVFFIIFLSSSHFILNLLPNTVAPPSPTVFFPPPPPTPL